MTDGEGNVYTYTYDLAGNLTSETDPKEIRPLTGMIKTIIW